MVMIRCDDCGKFVPYKDIEEGLAVNKMTVPDNHFGGEEYLSLCKVCNVDE